jgi:hypothetical protein
VFFRFETFSATLLSMDVKALLMIRVLEADFWLSLLEEAKI